MGNEETVRHGRVLLVSAPWPLFNRPSLPLGALKAYLSSELPRLRIEACHLFLQVANALGYADYQKLSHRVWRAETVFSALLYPDRAEAAESLYQSTLTRGDEAIADFGGLVRRVKSVTEGWLERIDWPAIDLVGFSVSFCQVTASLYLISRIKRICPSIPVVVGGSSFSGERSAELLQILPEIDYLILGEGERPLGELIRYILSARRGDRSAMVPKGVLTAGGVQEGGDCFCQLHRLDRLPPPDYDDYFDVLDGFPAPQRFFPVLPVEASRGCWWRRQDKRKAFKGCAFCNLNLQWKGYRAKPPGQVIRDIDHLVKRHRVLSLAFADNAFPINHGTAIFDGIRRMGLNLSMFTELRAKTPPELLWKMKKAGVDTVQIGIEALSSGLLAKMNKGVRAIDNLNMMKQCESVGIANASNLMLHFPSSDLGDVEETLVSLDFARWYRPLKTVSFWLGLGSPMHQLARRFHVTCTFNHPNVKKLFPEPVAAGLCFLIQGYRGDRRRQQRLWRPVAVKTRQWHADYAAMQRQSGGKPLLSYRDGGGFIIIDQHLPDQPAAKHRLSGASAEIYRYCHVPRLFDQVIGRFPTHPADRVHAFLKSMVDKRLMFSEQGCCLSLAVPLTGGP